MRYQRRIFMVGAVLLGWACGRSPHVPPEGLPELFEAVEAKPALYETAMDGCVQVHNVWKAQVRAVHLTARGAVADRVEMLRDSVYTPYSDFWDGYLGPGFDGWVRRRFDLAGHPARTNPTRTDFFRMIADATARSEEITGLRGCAEWYLVYGPGYANMGGLSDGRMLVDFFALGYGDDFDTEDMRRVVSHEVAHVLRGYASEPDAWTVLNVIVTEGMADYFKRVYWRYELSDAEVLGYSQSEWDWAVAHESELWRIAREQLEETSSAIIDQYQRSDRRLHPEGPPRVGYFLGYRISEAYMARHGPDALIDLFRLSARKILDDSGYSP
ncbi:MAG: DUF2268 domain-containing putative Zn-dependent protease [Gemmatimonadetes bacterium]|nr:DUF2268 domain-containing putative Zn-dependent protease [Gemmatimonadota bacterium]MYA43646.1 hypothetical protein [Gemmatimonadota bacterium]MYE95445.1 hypothetical protein [Gemmatimonadota bacterium]MYJ12090.1 hypothetical protein [Gemmatimonadota bacterium]